MYVNFTVKYKFYCKFLHKSKCVYFYLQDAILYILLYGTVIVL